WPRLGSESAWERRAVLQMASEFMRQSDGFSVEHCLSLLLPLEGEPHKQPRCHRKPEPRSPGGIAYVALCSKCCDLFQHLPLQSQRRRATQRRIAHGVLSSSGLAALCWEGDRFTW